VRRVERRDDDGVDARVADQRVRVGDRLRATLVRGRGRARGIGVGDGGHVRPRHVGGERADVGRPHHPRPDDPDADAHVT
jgi:hypothetical protein